MAGRRADRRRLGDGPTPLPLQTALTARTTSFEPLIAIRRDIGGRPTLPPPRPPSIIFRAAACASTLSPARTTSRLMATAKATRRSAMPYQGIHAADPPAVDRRERHLCGRAFPGHRLHGAAAPSRAGRAQASQALFRRRVGSRRTGVGGRGRCPALLGRTAGRRARAHRAPPDAEQATGPRFAAAGIRLAHHTFVRDTTEQAWADAEARVAEMAKKAEAGLDYHRRSVAVGQQRLLKSAGPGRCAGRQSLTPRRASSAAAAPAPPGWLARVGCREILEEIPRPGHFHFRAVGHPLLE